ncbi:hypothetical protein GCM10010244_57500 [Streptomyces coeruleorubidus]|nr:hypothetical protein GCM10010244_57500 [Streptomyces bellus]
MNKSFDEVILCIGRCPCRLAAGVRSVAAQVGSRGTAGEHVSSNAPALASGGGRGWRGRALLNGLGAMLTGVATVVVIVEKFQEGAWLVVVAPHTENAHWCSFPSRPCPG